MCGWFHLIISVDILVSELNNGKLTVLLEFFNSNKKNLLLNFSQYFFKEISEVDLDIKRKLAQVKY